MSRSLRAVLYARVSTDKGEQDPDRQDPESQLLRLRGWAKERGWRVIGEEADCVTCDPKRRRKDPPGFVRALRCIEERRADVIAIVGADRLVADPIALINLVARIQDLGGAIASVEDGTDLDTTTDSGEFNLYLRGHFNRMRVKLGRAATVRGIERARAAGKRLGRPPAPAPTLAMIEEAEAAAGRRLDHAELAEFFQTSVWAIRLVKNPGLKKQVGSDESQPQKEAL